MAEEGMLTSAEPAQTFTFVRGIETGRGSQDYLYGQEGEVEQLTTDQLKDYFEGDNVNRLQEQFGTFDNYLAYMTEREQLIQSGDYDTGNWAEADTGFSEDQEMILEGDADLTIDPSDPGQNLENLRRQQTSTQQGAYNNWINSEANQALLEKYGVSGTVYSDSGDKFQWNGSGYVKVEDAGAGVGDYVKIGLAVAAGVMAGAGISEALSGVLGATGSAAAGAGLGSVVSQGIATGEIDLEKALIAAATAGITNEFSEFLTEYVEGSTQEQLQRLRDIQATVQPGGEAYQAAQQQIDLLTGALEAADIANQGGNVIMNLTGNALEAYNQYQDIQENLDEFVNQNEDAAWQSPDVGEVLGEVQVQLRDYVS